MITTKGKTTHSKVASFLYELMRDHLSTGTIEEIVRHSEVMPSDGTVLCAGYLCRQSEEWARRLSDDTSHWVIYFEDTDKKDEVFTDVKAAMARYREVRDSWTCHLFARVPESVVKLHEEEQK